MRKYVWRLVRLYLGLSAGLCLTAFLLAGQWDMETLFSCGIYAGMCLVPQAVFVALVRPSAHLQQISGWSLLFSSLFAASAMTNVLVGGLLALDDLFRWNSDFTGAIAPIGFLPGIVLLLWGWRQDRLLILRQFMICIAIAGLLELLVAVPCHLVAMTRAIQGALPNPGLGSGVGLVIGFMTLEWSVGVLVVYLYYRRRRELLRGNCLACGYDLHGLSEMRCPECGRAFTFEEVHATAEELAFAGTRPRTPGL